MNRFLALLAVAVLAVVVFSSDMPDSVKDVFIGIICLGGLAGLLGRLLASAIRRWWRG